MGSAWQSLSNGHQLPFVLVSSNNSTDFLVTVFLRNLLSGTDLRQHLVGYLGRTALGLGLALVAAGLGVVLARMGLLLFGITSWAGWLATLLGGIGLGAGLGSLTAWLWLKGMGKAFYSCITLAAVTAGVAGAWIAFRYGSGVEPECCASPTMGPLAYAVTGAVILANLATLLLGVTGQTTARVFRRRKQESRHIPMIPKAEETFSR